MLSSPFGFIIVKKANDTKFRLSGVGGMFSSHQGFLLKYSESVHVLNKTNIVISRGLGNSTIPFMVNNRLKLLKIPFIHKG